MDRATVSPDQRPVVLIRVLHWLQYFGQVRPGVAATNVALPAVHSAPHCFCRACIADIPMAGVGAGAEAADDAERDGVEGVATGAAAGVAPEAGAAAGEADPESAAAGAVFKRSAQATLKAFQSIPFSVPADFAA